ncbi:hypothetical protein RhiJN_16216 [Ceratobasidium sp. AG-Ba]|nr:hypothetical protein RhiJN_16216 [Ceratobasidium sp. AG-Ba]
MQHTFHKKNWAWDYFERNNTKYRTDRTHWSAWCKGCLRFRIATLKEDDESLVLSGHIQRNRSEEEVINQAMDPEHAICGKIRNLHLHLAKCPHVEAQVRHHAALDRGLSRQHTSAVTQPASQVDTLHVNQEWFETSLCRTAASAGWSWNSINDPEFRRMMKGMRPDLEIPDRRTISGRVLDKELVQVTSELRDRVAGKLATGMCDGWKNITRASLIACMITVDEQAHITKIYDASGSRKTAKNLLSIVLENIKYAETELGTTIVAWCSDASGESRSMRHKLYTQMPYLVTPDCYAHQAIVGDIFKRVNTMKEVAIRANTVVKWFRNHSYPLDMLRQCQREEYGTILALIQPVITRWTAHYCSATRLLETMKALQVCAVRHETEMLESVGSAKSEERKLGKEVFRTIRDPDFWSQLLIMQISLRPLAVAANITQEADTHLDDVLIAMCNLYYAYSHRNDIPKEICAVAQDSLCTRWSKVDHDPFIGTIYVNPLYRYHLFNPNEPELRPMSLYIILKRLFLRFFPEDQFRAGEFMQANAMYADAKGPFSDENMFVQELLEQRRGGAGAITLAQIWANLAVGPVSGVQQYAKLAYRLVSIVPTSAGCERLFSKMGISHTKLRNRLTTPAACKIVQLQMNLRLMHLRDGVNAPRSDHQRGSDATAESDTQPEDSGEEADTRSVIADLIEDVDADQDVPDEDEATTSAGGDTTNSQSCTQRLPRIVFRWTREITLANIFDYDCLGGEKLVWKRARSFWAVGVANLKTEMTEYCLAEVNSEPTGSG